MATGPGGILGQLADLRRTVTALQETVAQLERALALLKEQVGGERGLSAAVNALAKEVASLRRAAYWVAGIIVASSIGFAFGVLALIPG